MNPALHIAYGTRGVAKLVAALSDGTPDVSQSLATLNGLMSSQECKLQALENDGAILPVLTGLLSSSEAMTRRQAALAIASLTLVYQGRIAAADAATAAALAGPLRADGDADVRAACAQAIESLTSSRDGCSVVMAAEGIVTKLTEALDDAKGAVVSASLAALAALSRLDLGVDEALAAGAVAKLAKLVDAAQRDANLLETGLQALWNLSNTPDGKTAAISAGLMDTLAKQIKIGMPKVKRLAAGCVMAITIDKDAKLAGLACVEPLCELLFAHGSEASAVRDAIGALKNITELPKARKMVDSWAKGAGVQERMSELFDNKLFDHKQWPASLRFQHQNVAPGGWASREEAATRERWGYPRPFAM